MRGVSFFFLRLHAFVVNCAWLFLWLMGVYACRLLALAVVCFHCLFRQVRVWLYEGGGWRAYWADSLISPFPRSVVAHRVRRWISHC